MHSSRSMLAGCAMSVYLHSREQTERHTWKARHSATSFREADGLCSCDQFENDRGRLKMYGGYLVLACRRQLARHASKRTVLVITCTGTKVQACKTGYSRQCSGQRQIVTASDFLRPSKRSIAPECPRSLIISATRPLSPLYY